MQILVFKHCQKSGIFDAGEIIQKIFNFLR